jgi:hypothetical protein
MNREQTLLHAIFDEITLSEVSSQIPLHDIADFAEKLRVGIGVPGVGVGHPVRPARLLFGTCPIGKLLLGPHDLTRMPLHALSRTLPEPPRKETS